jgi:hypothetical protein
MPNENIEPGEPRQVDGYAVSREEEDGLLVFHDGDGEQVGELMYGGPEHSGYAADEWVLRLLPSTLLHGLGQHPDEAAAVRNAAFYLEASKDE